MIGLTKRKRILLTAVSLKIIQLIFEVLLKIALFTFLVRTCSCSCSYPPAKPDTGTVTISADSAKLKNSAAWRLTFEIQSVYFASSQDLDH